MGTTSAGRIAARMREVLEDPAGALGDHTAPVGKVSPIDDREKKIADAH
jgi:hypothetical protein